MLVLIIGGRAEDEQHLARIAAKSGHELQFHRPAAEAEDGVGVAMSTTAEVTPGGAETDTGARPRALVFEALDRPDLAVVALRAVRKDPYFDGVGALLALHADQAANSELPGEFDDFMLHPYVSEELQLRIRALGRRRSAEPRPGAAALGRIVLDDASRDVFVDGHAVQLTTREFALLSHFCEWRGSVLSREHLLARVWGSRYSGGRRTVDIHVRRLRAKLGASLPLETLRGSGYRLRLEAEASRAHTDQIPEPFSKVS
jgi:DNA-binding winged helix-turn-helix (wHTH) protein